MKKYSVIPFLKKNGFERIATKYYKKENWHIFINATEYVIVKELNTKNEHYYTNDLNIYHLIGYLTYYNIIDRNYKT